TFVRGDTLVVRPANSRYFEFGFGKRRQAVTIAIGVPQLARLRMAGSGDVTLDGVNGERIALDVDGPGDLQASGAVRKLDLRVGGSGDADLH
ncbi:GIN domain-containing protein, partial [Acinetobacter baumannii]|uniref:GIN domain-containing protein n=1 Tax=Acinetobacter baumannii TaxID=470 RepID=UPI00289C49EF